MNKTDKDITVKKEILRAAERVFQKWGLNKTTMEDIAQEVGKGKSTLYYYYKSKEEIFYDVAVDELEHVRAVAMQAIKDVDTVKGKLRIYFVTVLQEIKKLVSLNDVISGEIKGRSGLIKAIREKIDVEEAAFIEELLRHGIKTGEFHFLDIKKITPVSHGLIAIMRSLQIELFVESNDKERVDIIIELLLAGL